MLDPDVVLASVVSAFQSIPEVVTALGGDPNAIAGHKYAYGAEKSLALTLFASQSPSVVVAYLDLIGGNFDGESVWKHRLEVYIRPKNAATDPDTPSPPHMWWLMMNKPIGFAPYIGLGLNFRQVRILPDLLPIDAMPGLTHRQDANLADFFCGALCFTEYGDS